MDGWLRQSTAVTVPIGPFIDSTDGDAEETGLTIAQADVRLSKNGAASAQKNNATSASHDADGVYLCPLSTTDTNTLGQLVAWVHVAGALFAKHVFMVVPANVWDSLFGSDLLQVDAREYVGVAGVAGAIPAVAAGANGGLPLGNASGRVDVGNWLGSAPNALQSGRVDSYLGAVASGVIAAGSFAANALDAVWSTTTRTLSAFAFSVTVGTNNDKTGYGLSAAAIQAVWDALTSALTTVGSIGRLLVDNINATISSRLASASYTAPLDAAGTRSAVGLGSANLDTQLADIPTNSELADRTLAAADYATAAAQSTAQTSLDDIPTNAEMNARTLAAASYATASAQATAQTSLNTIDGRLDTEIQAIIDALALINLDTDDIQARLPAALVGGRMDSNASAINASTAAAVRLALSAGQIIPGTVDHAGTPATTTQMDADDITTAAADHYNGRVIIFTSGTLIGQATSISDYALVAGRGRFTFPDLTAAPADNVTFIIV